MTGFNLFNYFARNADSVLIGRFLGAQDLGYYSLAYRLLLYPLQTVSHVIGRVMFPVYAQLQTDDARFRRAYLKTTGAIAFVTFPMMLGLMMCARPFVLTLFGAQWMPVIPLVMILAPVGMLQSIVTTVGAIYLAKGRTDYMLRWGIVTGILAMVAFAIGLPWGVRGVAVAYALATAICLIPNCVIPFRLIQLRIGELRSALLRPFICSAAMFMALVGLQVLLPLHLSSGSILGILVLVGLSFYLCCTWVMNRGQVQEILSLVGAKG